jgi:flagellar assembly protein FliH
MPSLYKILKADQANDMGFFRVPLMEIERSIQATEETGSDGLNSANSKEMQSAAEELIHQAKLEAEVILETGRKEAMEEKARILDGAKKAAAIERETACACAAAFLQEAKQIRDRVVESAEDHILDLTLKIAQDLLKTVMVVNPAIIADLIRDAVSMINNEEQLVIRVSPSALDAIKEKKADFVSLLSENASLRIIPDQELKDGDCVVQGQYARVDALLQERFARIERALKGASDHHES